VTAESILILPDEPHTYWVKVDSSDYITRAVLSQPDVDRKWHPVTFYSKSLNDIQRNYEIHDKETLTIVQTLEEWQATFPQRYAAPSRDLDGRQELGRVLRNPVVSGLAV
jgi:hypothetical protein